MKDKIAALKFERGYAEGQELPSLDEEAIATVYESEAEAFFAGYDRAIDDVLALL